MNKPVIQKLDWDSNFFGAEIGRVLETSPSGIRSSVESDFECLYLLLESDDFIARHEALESGFEFVGHRVTYSSNQIQRSTSAFEGEIRRIERSDLEVLSPIVADAFHDSRFFWDRGFSDAQARSLYVTWLSKAVENSYHDECLCAVLDGTPVGFVTLDVSDDGQGRIGIIGVAPDTRGMGVGTGLVAAAHDLYLSWGATRASVVTHGSNLGAQRLYARNGYLIARVESWFHYWSNR